MHRTTWLALLPGLALLISMAGLLGAGCAGRDRAAAGRESAKPPEPAATAARSTPTFEGTVRPILASHCAPCHDPGGRMYDTLPFDQPSVVSAHADGVRRRLKGDDRKTLEEWLATLPPPSR